MFRGWEFEVISIVKHIAGEKLLEASCHWLSPSTGFSAGHCLIPLLIDHDQVRCAPQCNRCPVMGAGCSVACVAAVMAAARAAAVAAVPFPHVHLVVPFAIPVHYTRAIHPYLVHYTTSNAVLSLYPIP